MNADSDHALIERSRRGDARAFQRLFERHARSVWGVCMRILGDAGSAEDAVQEAFLKAHRRLDQFDGRSAFATWMHRIAVNTAIELLRRRHPEVEPEAQSDLLRIAAETEDPELTVSQAQMVRGVTQALQELTPLERSVFVLRHLEQRSLAEIAGLLSSNVNACKQAIFRAVRKMRAQLAAFESSVP